MVVPGFSYLVWCLTCCCVGTRMQSGSHVSCVPWLFWRLILFEDEHELNIGLVQFAVLLLSL